MNRSDLRLVIAIVSTGAIAAIGSAAVTRALAPPPVDTTALDRRIATLEHDIAALNVRVGELADRVATHETPLPAQHVDPFAEPVHFDCDEVSCVLNNYEPACCAKFKRGTADSLDRAQIADGIAKVKPLIAACGDKSSAKGKVKVHVTVAPDGSVSALMVEETPDNDLANCVAGVVHMVRFAATRDGGSFGYPFIF